MGFTVQFRAYAYDNIQAGTPAGQEQKQSYFFAYTPGNVDPVYPDNITNGNALGVNRERVGNGVSGNWPYGTEIP